MTRKQLGGLALLFATGFGLVLALRGDLREKQLQAVAKAVASAVEQERQRVEARCAADTRAKVEKLVSECTKNQIASSCPTYTADEIILPIGRSVVVSCADNGEAVSTAAKGRANQRVFCFTPPVMGLTR